MIDISILRAMVEAGATVEAILAAVEADQKAEGERVQARREKDAERQRRHRLSQAVTRSHSDSDVSLSSLLSSSESITKKVESKKERARKSLLPATWKPNEAHYAKADKFGIPADAMLMKADDMRNWAASKAIMRADWDATFHGFLRPKETMNGSGGPRPFQDASKSVTQALRRMEEAAERGELTIKPRPSLLPESSGSGLRLLPKG